MKKAGFLGFLVVTRARVENSHLLSLLLSLSPTRLQMARNSTLRYLLTPARGRIPGLNTREKEDSWSEHHDIQA